MLHCGRVRGLVGRTGTSRAKRPRKGRVRLKPGERLKGLRHRLGITTREVEEYSRQIGDAEHNEDYTVSNAWLSAVENGESTPSIYKLYSLSVIYGIKFTDLLLHYGVDLERISKHRAELPLAHTRLTELAVYDNERRIVFPMRLDPGFKLTLTNLLPRMVESWGEVPIALIQHLNISNSLYGYIGLAARTMYPILRPGSFVRIDDKYTTVQEISWRTDYDRPIYFIEIRNGYICSWCELQGKQLLLIPHPQSGYKVRQYAFPNEAEILGRVTAVAMTIVDPVSSVSDDSPKLPTPS